ncbi:hypothetical protein ACTWJ9_04440 [Streptomyces sp. GDS52]|uniref:hypothetical protein n=1 Tax=Streptomyces sp. GDS52 TaxID=3406419 RepID=UPI003FD497C6
MPSLSTIRQVVGAVCPGGLADLTGQDPADPPDGGRQDRPRSRRRDAPAVYRSIATGLREMSCRSLTRPLELLGIS